jgi:hypothetical protein
MAGLSKSFLKALATDLGLTVPILEAVIAVESSGQPFLPTQSFTPKGIDVSGFPVIQFEGHIFWQQLVATKSPALNPSTLLSDHPEYFDIIYPRLDKRYMLKPLPEWDQLFKARRIHHAAADKSASWGAFQVMGFNAETVGFDSIGAFADAMFTLEGQTKAFVGYLKAVPRTIDALKRQDWETFARLYNGPGYAKGRYHIKLRQEYVKRI